MGGYSIPTKGANREWGKGRRLDQRLPARIQKTIRQLFEKQQEEDKDYKADYFAIFEQTINPSPLNFQEGTPFSSPAQKQGSSILTRSREMSSSANKAGFVSRPVLKQVKNKALHEKYIDQLHRRDAKRKAESLRNEKHKHIQEQTSLLEVNSVKFAKDAQDAINQFRGLQYGTNDDSDDNDDDDDDDDDDTGTNESFRSKFS